jgi:hypothetical protein
LINFSVSLLSEENRISYNLLLSLELSAGVCEDSSPAVGISFLKMSTVMKTKPLRETGGGFWERQQLLHSSDTGSCSLQNYHKQTGIKITLIKKEKSIQGKQGSV